MPKSSVVADTIPFNNEGTDLTSLTVQDVIVEVNTKVNSSSGGFNIDKILVDNFFDTLADNEGNLLEGNT